MLLSVLLVAVVLSSRLSFIALASQTIQKRYTVRSGRQRLYVYGVMLLCNITAAPPKLEAAAAFYKRQKTVHKTTPTKILKFEGWAPMPALSNATAVLRSSRTILLLRQ